MPAYFPQRRQAPSPFGYSTGGVQDDGSFSSPGYNSTTTHAIAPTVSYHGPAGVGSGDGGLAVGGVPYLPPGYKAPSPQYIDQASRAGLDAENRQFRQTNFQNSTLRANDPNSPQRVSEGVFSAQRRQFGATRAEADAAAYGVRHGAPFQPQGYGQIGQPGPTIVIPPYGGSRAGGGQPYSIPGGADVMTPYGGTGVKERPLNPRDRSSIAQTYNNMGATTQPSDAEAKADKDIADARAAAQPGQPAQPAAPSAPMNAQRGPEEAYNKLDSGKLNLTEEHARSMWDTLLTTNPNSNVLELLPRFHQIMQHYGVNPDAAAAMTDQWIRQSPTLAPSQPQTKTQVKPGTRVPISMLGTDNGLDAGQRGRINGGNVGSVGTNPVTRQSQPGPSINTPSQVTTTEELPQNQRGYTPINETYGNEGARGAPAAAATTRPTTQPAGIARVSSDQEWASLPPGTEFIGPDGVHRRK